MTKENKEKIKKNAPKSRQSVRAKAADERISEKQLFHNGSSLQQPKIGSTRSLEQEIVEKQQGRRGKSFSGLGQKPGAFPVSNHNTMDRVSNLHLELMEIRIAAMTRITTPIQSPQDPQKALKNADSFEHRDADKDVTSRHKSLVTIAHGTTSFEALEARIATKICGTKRASSGVDFDVLCTASTKKYPYEILSDIKDTENRDRWKAAVAATAATTSRNSRSIVPRNMTSAEVLEAQIASKICQAERSSLGGMRLQELEERVEAKRRAVGVSKMPRRWSEQNGKRPEMKELNDPTNIEIFSLESIKTTKNDVTVPTHLAAKKISCNMATTGNEAPRAMERLEQQLCAKRSLFVTRRTSAGCYANKDSSTFNEQNLFTTRIRRLEQQLCAKERIFAGEGSRMQPARDRPATLAAHWSTVSDHERFNEIENQVTCKSFDGSEEMFAGDMHDEPSDSHIGRIIDCSADLEEGEMEDPEFHDMPLAVAVPVAEEPAEAFIPSAVRYDPEEKMELYRNRRFCLYGFLVTFILALLAFGILTVVSFTQTKEQKNSAQFIHYRENLGIIEVVEQVVGPEVLNNDSSPYAQALQWITYQDPQYLAPDAPNFMQRYILAYLYFSTRGNKGWSSCNPPNQENRFSCVWNQVQSVSQLKRLQVTSVRWLSLRDECSWAGISCDKFGQVRGINLGTCIVNIWGLRFSNLPLSHQAVLQIVKNLLAGFDLSGSFPVGIVHLPFLQSVSLNLNNLTGPLPTDVSTMKYLVSIELQNNEFMGRIPQEWFDLRNLQHFNVGGNQLTGQISSSFQKLSDLKLIYLHKNMITGEIPTELGELNSLSFIRLDRNLLKGTIPQELGNAKKLNGVFLQNNNLSGTIPSELGALQHFDAFRVENNERLSGEIPESILPSLEELGAFNCNLTGDLTGKFSLMKNMKILKIHNNNFAGKLPSNLGETMPLIQELWISGNQFTGTVPDSICDLRGPFSLTELVADCASSSSGIPELSCPKNCCTQCCISGGNCLATSYSN